ncbi:unnamed protein product [Clonostachys rosea]|uniref:Trichothecene 3-O-acetyltransferase-like N-terminal domain-containing protein n=1 Tax=Bionectria ochroleuca TaxID=29856 RepID=A0ABY6UE78_BIOOC|nr:unnamed protein product [Clonostachys rosea]
MASNLDHIPLGPMDHMPPPTPQPGIIYFRIQPGITNEQVFEHLKEGLYQTFLQTPWLNGKIYAQSPDAPGWRPGQLEIRFNPNVGDTGMPKCYQLRYNELEPSLSLDDLEMSGFPVDSFDDEQLTWVSYKPQGTNFNEGFEVVAAQANFIPGACLLVPSVHHAACDAIGMGVFLKLWGDQCRILSLRSQGSSDSVALLPPETWDRALPARICRKEATGHSVADVSPDTWQLIGLDPPGPQADGLRPAKRVKVPPRAQTMSSRIYYMPATAFKDLQHEGKKRLEAPDVSGNDIILALLWRTLMRARVAARAGGHDAASKMADLDSQVELQTVCDARPDFSHHLPSSYIGNCVFYHRTKVPLRALIELGSPLSFVAHSIRLNARNINHEQIMDAYMLVDSMPDWTLLQPLRHMSVEDTWMMSSMIMIPEDATCFGDSIFANGGHPVGFRMLMGSRNRSQVPACYVMPRKKHGGLELVLSVFEDEWEFVDKDEEFGRYTMHMA